MKQFLHSTLQLIGLPLLLFAVFATTLAIAPAPAESRVVRIRVCSFVNRCTQQRVCRGSFCSYRSVCRRVKVC